MDDDKILVLHRNAHTLEKLSKSLRNSGYSTIISSNSEEAYELILDLKPDIVFWGDDLNLHNQEIIRKIKKLEIGKDVSIIALYDNAQLYDRIVAQHYGIDDFLPLNAKYDEIKSKIHFFRSINNKIKTHNRKAVKYKSLSETNFSLMTSQDLGNTCEIIIQYLLDSYSVQSLILSIYNSSIKDFDYFNILSPAKEIDTSIDIIQHHTIWSKHFFNDKILDAGEITDQNILKVFRELRLEFNKLFQYPLQYKGSLFGVLLISFLPGAVIDEEEQNILTGLGQAAAFRIKEIRRRFGVRRSADSKDYHDDNLFHRPSESEVYMILSRHLRKLLRADVCLYMNYNEGFRFLYPKYLFKGENNINLFETDKPPVLLIKDFATFDDLLETRNPIIINTISDKYHKDIKSLPGFRQGAFTNIFIYPVAVANAVQGFFVLGEESVLKKYTNREIQQCGKIIDNATKILEENQILKEAKILVKQLDRIFALGTELTLDFPLNDILKRISTAIRRTLGWNVVILDKKNNYTNRYETINVLGLEPANYKKLLKKEKYPIFKNKMDSSYRISQSYFYDHKYKNIENKKEDLNDFAMQVGTEWKDNDWIFVPIKSRGKQLGMIAINDPVDRRIPNEDRIKSVEYFANQAAVVMENAELFDSLKSSELKYRMLAETMTMGLVTCDMQGAIQYINSSLIRMLKYTIPQEFANKKIYDFCTSNSKHKLEKEVIKIIKNQKEPSDKYEEAQGVDVDLVGQDGEVIPFMIYFSPYYQQKQRVGFFGVLSDLRNQKKIERLKSDFNSMIVHDLRSPLNIIQGYVDIVRTQVVGKITDEQAELLSIAKENVYKVLKLIDNFLIGSKLDTGQYKIDLETGSINDLIDTIIEHYLILSDRKKIKLESILDPNIPLLNFDKFRLEQVITNLLSNALKFTPRNGNVSIATRLKRGKSVLTGETDMFAEVSVKDTGVGISKEEIKKVFNKYEQTEAGRNAALKGTGLGLAISREIIELHKGEVWVESEKNIGSTFYFTLPIIPHKL